MIYITGDCHGNYSRFARENFPQQDSMTKDDFMIVCGDFGLWEDSPRENKVMDALQDLPFTILWVDGNHENYDLIRTFPVQKWHGGNVQFIRPNVIHLMRGQVFEIDGYSFFTFGGANCHDIDGGVLDPDAPDFEDQLEAAYKRGLPFRVNHLSWWKEEMPSEEEMEEGRRNLAAHGNKVNFIITHDCPASLKTGFSEGELIPDHLNNYLEEIKRNTDYGMWFFGHYHHSGFVDDKDLMLYDAIARLVTDPAPAVKPEP